MAELGHSVVGLDTDEAKVDKLSQGVSPFYEPEFDELLRRNVEAGRLTFSTNYEDARDAQIHFIGVGTPQRPDGYGADLRYVEAATDALLDVLPDAADDPVLIAGKSTVPVGTAAHLAEKFAPTGAIVMWNPEFLREGFAVQDTLRPDRIVYGLPSDTAQADVARRLLDECYADLLAAEIPKVETDYATAELVKVAANAFLATKISFINAMAELTDATGGNVKELAEAIGYDDRIGKKFLRAGIGFGGGCLPKDIRAFMARADELGRGESLEFLRDIDTINTRQRERAVTKLTEALGGSLAGKKIAVLGQAFKPNSDDIRDSPAVDIAGRVLDQGASVVAFDPKALPVVQKFLPERAVVDSIEAALTGADAVMVLTEWKEFQELDPVAARELVSSAIVVDGRNCLPAAKWREAGWQYIGMGV